MTLSFARVSAEYCITEIKASPVKRRLLDMGFTSGSKIRVLAVDPLKKAMLVKLRGGEVALRKNATDFISVEELNGKVCAYRQSERGENKPL